MRITYSYRNRERLFETHKGQVVVGRSDESEAVDLDLEPDRKVSRRHGRIWAEGRQYWIEDLESARGTLVSGVEIKGRGPRPLEAGDTVRMGETTLRLVIPEAEDKAHESSHLEFGTTVALAELPGNPRVEIAETLDAGGSVFAAVESATAESARRLEVLCELPLQFATETRWDALLQTIVDRLMEVIPGAARGALLLRDPCSDMLLLKAYQSSGEPAVSETLARRAMRERRGFIWRRGVEGDISGSIAQQRIQTGLYAPLLWQGEALGAICVDNPSLEAAFTEDALRLMLAVAQYGAMAIAGHQLQEKLRLESAGKANLMRQFSPKVAERLLACRGRLRLGGERSEVAIVCADIRGFTEQAKDLDPDEVVEMLNEYFAYLVPVIFAHHGTLDKYIGDAVLAIFGSPEPDPEHPEQAVRAGLEMQAAVVKLNEARKARGVTTLGVGIGIHRGEVVHGFIGTSDRMEFTVIGDAVNRTSRYCEGASAAEVLISPEMHERVWRIVEAQRTTIPTKHEGELVAYRVKCLKEGAKG